MAKKFFVYSTLTNDIYYGPWLYSNNDLPTKPAQVLVRGGANRADVDNRLWTPRGEVTPMTQGELDICQQDPVFKQHVANGYITIHNVDEDPDHVAKDMTERSPDAPITPEVIEKENERKPADKQQQVAPNVPTPRKAPTRRRNKKD